jgi:replicative DNA helicase
LSAAVLNFDDYIAPHAVKAEAAILGGILLDNELVHEAAEMLRPGDFFLHSNRLVFVAMLALHKRNERIDAVTLTEFLKGRNEFEKVGGVTKLAEYVGDVAALGSIAPYAKIVKQKAQIRAIQQAAQSISEMCQVDPDNPTLAADAQQMIFNACDTVKETGFVHIGDAAADYLANVDAVRSGQSNGDSLLTGFDDLDDHTLGLVRGDLIILAGRPSNGKTSLSTQIALNIARHNVERGLTVAFFSLEMSTRQISEKAISNLAKVDSMRMRAGCLSDDEWQRALGSLAELHYSGLHICDASRLTTSEIKAKSMRMKREKGLDLIIVDHLSEMGGDRKLQRRERIGDAARDLKAIAKTLNVPVLALSQLNRAVESRNDNEPQMSDLSESGDIEQAADVIMFIYNEQDKVAGNVATIKIGKSRNGKTGHARLAYRKEMNWLGDLARNY